MNISRIVANTLVDSNGCWIWQKSCSSSGYGQLTEDKVYWNTHVYSFSCFNDKPAKGQVVRHTCNVPKCCNPDHLLLGTHKDNWKDSKDTHTAASTKRRTPWIVNGVHYSTAREVREKTGISMNSIIKFSTEGLFDVQRYREGCEIANKEPKV